MRRHRPADQTPPKEGVADIDSGEEHGGEDSKFNQ
jgi:hypothetical protein